jgi:hypothetical protein
MHSYWTYIFYDGAVSEVKDVNSSIEELRKILKNIFKSRKAMQHEHFQKDLEGVMRASRLLQISEFRFFDLAYAQWYGQSINENGLEHIFAAYMFEDIVPHWVRHFTRKVISMFEQGTLNPREFNIERPKASHELRCAGIGYTVILTVMVVVFCLLIINQPSPY